MLEDQEDDEVEHLADVKERLRAHSGELRCTIHAIKDRRYTPEQIRAVIDRAKRLVYRGIIIRRRCVALCQVH